MILTLALPSKGRLQEQVARYLDQHGTAIERVSGTRDYRARLAGFDGMAVKLMSAGEIADGLCDGSIQLGITGEDLVRETVPDPEGGIAFLVPLGFGRADVVVAVPKAWIDVTTMADLDDVCSAFHLRHHRQLRVATKYVHLTRNFFAAHGIGDYRIVESLGATEGAPAAGSAQAIVDITTTGATLAANGLKVLDDGVILRSQAWLVASRRASWSMGAVATAGKLAAALGTPDRAALATLGKGS